MTKDCDQVAVDTAFLIKIVESDNGILLKNYETNESNTCDP